MPSQTESHCKPEPAPAAAANVSPYVPVRHGDSIFLDLRGLRHHVRRWQAEPAAVATAGGARTVFLLHGWMDMSASFQFVVDLLPAHWTLLAPDWRGFGLTDRPAADCYWFPDYLADLDGLLGALAPEGPVDLVAHSMGGNAAMLYAGVRPERVRRLVNLEGLGMPDTDPAEAPERYRKWLDGLRAGASMRDYPSRQAVAERLMQNNPRLAPERAAFLAQHWGVAQPDGRFALAGDPAHRLPNPVLYRLDEVLAVWRRIEAEVLWVDGEYPGKWQAFTREPAYAERLAAIRHLSRRAVPGAGHMLHHDRPDTVAALISEFLS